MTSSSCNPLCVKCAEVNNTNGLFTCRGCQRNYCSDHTIEHRNDLRDGFEEVINAYDSMQNTFQILEQRLDEKRAKILNEEQKIHEMRTSLNQIKVQLIAQKKQNNYLEEDLLRWMSEINKLKSTLNPIESNDIIKDVDTTISDTCPSFKPIACIIIVVLIMTLLLRSALSSKPKIIVEQKQSLPSIAFDQANGPTLLLENKQVAEHFSTSKLDGTFRIDRVYMKGVHHVRISFEELSPSDAFVGIISQSNKHQLALHSPEFSSGWLIRKNMVTHNDPEMLENLKVFFTSLPSMMDSVHIRIQDMLTIEIDCDNRKIGLINERTKRKFELQINHQRYPLPWQIVFNFNLGYNRVRLHP